MSSSVRGAAVLFGAIYLAVGIIGFLVTGFDGFAVNGDEAILVFDVNPFHNLVHLGIGALWLGAARLPRVEAVEGIHIGIGAVLALTAVLGIVGALEALSIDGATAPDNLLHLVSALPPIVVGLASSRRSGWSTATS